MFQLRRQWYDAINIRYSVRDYLKKSLEIEKVAVLNQLIEDINDKCKGIRLEFINKKDERIFKGIIGGYGKITPSPAYVVLIEDVKNKNTEEKLGYYGEAFVLEATSLGLGTCWVSGTFNRKVVEESIIISENEKVHSIIAIGYEKEKKSFSAGMISKLLRSKKRKTLDKISFGIKETTPKWVLDGIKAARLAPSALNKQPWKFKIHGEKVIITISQENKNNKLSPKLDCGIAMLHFELAVLHNGVKGEWIYLSVSDVAKFSLENK